MRIIIAMLCGLLLTATTAQAQAPWTAGPVIDHAAVGSPPGTVLRPLLVNGEVALMEEYRSGTAVMFTVLRLMPPLLPLFPHGYWCREDPYVEFFTRSYEIRDVNRDGNDDLVVTRTSDVTVAWLWAGWARCR